MDKPDIRFFHILSDQLRQVNEEHDLYHSPHEGYGIIREEIIEMGDEYDAITEQIMKLDECVRYDDNLDQHLTTVMRAKASAINMLMETTDLLVTLDRYIISAMAEEGEFAHASQDDGKNIQEYIDLIMAQYLSEENETAHKCLRRLKEER